MLDRQPSRLFRAHPFSCTLREQERILSLLFCLVITSPSLPHLPLSSFSRLRCKGTGAPQLRSPDWPLGHDVGDSHLSELVDGNVSLEFTAEVFAAALKIGIPVLLVAPEFLGSVGEVTPCNPWEFIELKSLLSEDGVFTGAFCGCELAGTSTKRPLRVLTSFTSLRKLLHLGPPVLQQVEGRQVYRGPLPIDCACGRHVRGMPPQLLEDLDHTNFLTRHLAMLIARAICILPLGMGFLQIRLRPHL